MKLSIIIPCYNSTTLNELLDCLEPQLTEEVEVIVINDGSTIPIITPNWVKRIDQMNGGVSSARNAGLDKAGGEYIAFIDADDLVADNYIKTILSKIKDEQFDYCYLSWNTIGTGWQQTVKLTSLEQKFPQFNLCVWNRVYKKSMIGKVRFNERKLVAEDAEFIRKVKEENHKKAFISDFMYYYRSDSKDSVTKRFANGEIQTERIVYYYPQVTKDMDYLIDEFKDADQDAEVILMTNSNEIKELENYAMVLPPQQIKGTELRGEKTSLFKKIELPVRTQVVIYTSQTFNIGGIETWIYNFCSQMVKYYDILVLYDKIDPAQLERLVCIVPCKKRDGKRIITDTLIINRITDKAPQEVSYKQKIQMVHACKMVDTWKVPTDNDKIVCVSDVVNKSFDDVGITINNLTNPQNTTKPLLLVSATRTGTFEKGLKRMQEFAKLLKTNGIDFIWLVFSDNKVDGDNIVWLQPTLDIIKYISKADYLVQLSDAEGFCYSIVEALEVGTPVLTTPIEVLPEIGFVDTQNGYIVPFDVTEDKNIKRILNVPKFDYEYDNLARVKQWRKILGNTKPTRKYNPSESKTVFVTSRYYDTQLDRYVSTGEVIKVPKYRADRIIQAGFGMERV